MHVYKRICSLAEAGDRAYDPSCRELDADSVAGAFAPRREVPALFRMKVCGVTTTGDALFAAGEGADAIGLNFYAPSPRSVSVDQACAIAGALAASETGRPLVIGVFVNETAERIAAVVERVGLDGVQLHGDEPPQMIADLPPRTPVIRAVRVGAEGLGPTADHLMAASRAGRAPDVLLLDAASGSAYGGTGCRVDLGVLARDRGLLGAIPLVLAGGLNAQNVAEAIRTAAPWGVDVASGVESSPGVKDVDLVRRFLAEARLAFAAQA
jgi:phosphoribosylanthranilate isomerase